jgi:hypothetical protein
MNDTTGGSQRDRECVRHLPNGMILTAVSEPARQAMDPLLIVDALEREWHTSPTWDLAGRKEPRG